MHLIIIRKKLIYNRAKQRLISRALALWAKVWERARGRVYGRLMSLTRLRARAGARDPYLHDVFKNNYRGRSGDSHGARREPTQRVYMYVCIRARYSISYPLFFSFLSPHLYSPGERFSRSAPFSFFEVFQEEEEGFVCEVRRRLSASKYILLCFAMKRNFLPRKLVRGMCF